MVEPWGKVMSSPQVLTTGSVAKLLQVAPRTVSQWCESGKLKSYKLPMLSKHQHRRITMDSLLQFCREQGLPIQELMDSSL